MSAILYFMIICGAIALLLLSVKCYPTPIANPILNPNPRPTPNPTPAPKLCRDAGEEVKKMADFRDIGVFVLIVLITLGAMVLTFLVLINGMTPNDEEKKVKGVVIDDDESSVVGLTIAESISSDGQTDKDQFCKVTFENSDLPSIGCPKEKALEKQPHVEVDVICPSETTGAKWQNGVEAVVVCRMEMAQTTLPHEEDAVFCQREMMEEKLPTDGEQIDLSSHLIQ
ncbi:hypothetical protein Btru_038930 [Bulinus truncatus]|nr:hypothetical protein Btru_038930 [Bulinus truncatus]